MSRFAFLVLLGLVAGCATQQPARFGVPNWGIVDRDQHIVRGGQPDAFGWQWLVSHGITNDVKLNTGKDPATPGMTVKAFPITTWQQIFGGKKLRAQLNAAEKAIGPGTFLHCTHGKNRTGTVVGYYRVNHDWPRAVAEREMLRYGWGDSLPGLKAAWKRP